MNLKPENEKFREGFVEAEAEEQKPPEKPDVVAEKAAPPPEIEPPPLPEELKPLAEVWPIKVKLLHKPIRNTRGEYIHEITFREPTGGDINRCGNPMRINQHGDLIIEERKMTEIMGRLSGVLTPYIEMMDPRDWNSCAYRLQGFFLPDPEAW